MVPSILDRLVSTDFMPHGYCFLWFPEILWLHVFSDSLIAISYFMIPVALAYFVWRRREIPYPWILLMFAAFILACGVTHVAGVWTIWQPDYGIEGLLKLGTGLISFATALLLIPLIPHLLALRSPRELELVNQQLGLEIAEHERTQLELRRARDELERRVAQRTRELADANIRLQDEVEERSKAQEQLTLMAQELNHRIKNVLAVVQSIASRSITGDGEPALERDAFIARLHSLSRMNARLLQTNWRGADLRDLASDALEPYAQGDAVELDGPPLIIHAKASTMIALVLHELASNAAKYGALSVPEGRASLTWTIADGELRLTWQERDGPRVRPPDRRGFGTLLLERAVGHELDGRIELDFAEAGVIYRLAIELARIAGPIQAAA